jgi:hypothetical protein
MNENAVPDDMDETDDDHYSENYYDDSSYDDGYCVFCGEEIEVSDDGYLKCRNCGYDESYEKGKVG